MIVVALCGLLVLSANLWGRNLPAQHTVKITQPIAAPIDDVWRCVTDFGGQIGWRKDLKGAERLDDRDGHPAWREVYKGGEVKTSVTLERHKPNRLILAINDENGPYRGRWTYELTQMGAVTQLSIIEVGHIDNPIARLGLKYVVGEATYLKSYVAALVTHLQKG